MGISRHRRAAGRFRDTGAQPPDASLRPVNVAFTKNNKKPDTVEFVQITNLNELQKAHIIHSSETD
jgi:hypothetical protein